MTIEIEHGLPIIGCTKNHALRDTNKMRATLKAMAVGDSIRIETHLVGGKRTGGLRYSAQVAYREQGRRLGIKIACRRIEPIVDGRTVIRIWKLTEPTQEDEK